MFRKKKSDELDVESLNELILLGKKILSIGFAVIIISLIVLIIYILRTLNVFGIVKDFLVVISPVFIGLIIAWLFDPLVDFLQKKKIPRIVSFIIVYVIFIGLLSLLIFFYIQN